MALIRRAATVNMQVETKLFVGCPNCRDTGLFRYDQLLKYNLPYIQYGAICKCCGFRIIEITINEDESVSLYYEENQNKVVRTEPGLLLVELDSSTDRIFLILEHDIYHFYDRNISVDDLVKHWIESQDSLHHVVNCRVVRGSSTDTTGLLKFLELVPRPVNWTRNISYEEICKIFSKMPAAKVTIDGELTKIAKPLPETEPDHETDVV